MCTKLYSSSKAALPSIGSAAQVAKSARRNRRCGRRWQRPQQTHERAIETRKLPATLFGNVFVAFSLFRSDPFRFLKANTQFSLSRAPATNRKSHASSNCLSLCFGRRRRRNDRCNPLAGLAARINLASNATSQAQATFAHFRRRNHAPQRSARKTKPNVSLSASHFWQASGDGGGDNKGAKLQSKRRILAPPPPQTQ